ncbi:MAG TPA: cyclic nucleotide-binding domain-containing protein [Panacibacter sp.]|nr:cyclic nucleotide-binding domain-containing protein [Panacibacter sp.]
MILIEKVLLLKNSHIFENCSETDLLEIAAVCGEAEEEKNVTIFSKGDEGNCMYFIYKGEVLIHDNNNRLAVLKENEIFGELSLLDSETRSASATTVTDCYLLKIDRESFYDILAANTEILKGIMKTICSRLREQDKMNAELIKLSETAV